jgi:His/Glu/Gln/Arg/opine family amino acid ABC transporter permease subunit
MSLDFTVLWTALPRMIEAVGITIQLSFLSMAIGIAGGLVAMLLRVAPNRALSLASFVCVEVFRNVPLILLVYWGYYVLPIALGIRLSAFSCGLIALSLVVSAYNAETFRAGVNSIRRGQYDAALALGMSKFQMYWRVIIPQAASRILPILASTWVSLFKDTSLVSVIGVHELAYVSLEIRSSTFRVLEILTAMALIYWCLGYPQAKLVDWLHKKFGAKE